MIQSIKERAQDGHIPIHIAIIMDGNGRWAKERSLPRVAGHKEGINSVREITRLCGEIGVKHLTLYTFSTENWRRPKAEVSALMTLLLKTISIEVRELHKQNVRFTAIGNLEMLPQSTQNGINDGIEITKNNTGLNLCLALNYGSRQEILNAIKEIAHEVHNGAILPESITMDTVMSYFYTAGVPDPDLLIRTGGEFRLSNFLLWQIAYSEIYVYPSYWPSFREKELLETVHEFQLRERRFGNVGQQLSSNS